MEFLVSLSSRWAHVLLGKKAKLINYFLYENIFLFYDDNISQLRQLTRNGKYNCDKSQYFSNNGSVQNNF